MDELAIANVYPHMGKPLAVGIDEENEIAGSQLFKRYLLHRAMDALCIVRHL